MEIVRTNVSDKKVLFRLTHAQDCGKMQDLEGQVIPINDYALYLDGDAPETLDEKDNRKLVFVMEVNGEVYGTISKTFIDSVMDIILMFQDENDWAVLVKGNNSKSGRHFIYAEIV